MTPSPDAIRTTVENYLKFVAGGTVDDILGLFAEGATVEDPVGTDVRTTEASLREFYSVIEPLEQEAELLTLRIAGDTAAFHFRLVTNVGEQKFELSPIDVMTFDEKGKITTMRAVWSADDMLTS